jgi:hypothetical protein
MAAPGPWQYGTQGAVTTFIGGRVTVDYTTCVVGPKSPRIPGLGVGAKVTIVCNDGVLTDIALWGQPRGERLHPRQRVVVRAEGTVGMLTEIGSFVTAGVMRCNVGSRSPSLRGFHSGQQVVMICRSGVLVRMKPRRAPVPSPACQIERRRCPV